VLFNIRTDVDPPVAHDLTDITPFSRPLQDAGIDPLYQEIALPCDGPWSGLPPGVENMGIVLALTAARSHRDGQITREQREIFSAAASQMRLAWRTQIALRLERFQNLTQMLEALSIAAFVSDSSGKVGTLTPAAESLLTAGRGLQLVEGRICASRLEDAHALSGAISSVTTVDMSAGYPLLRTLVIRGEAVPVVIDVFALPYSYSFGSAGFTPSVLLVARGATGGDRRRAAILQAMYGFTGAETEIALRLAQGKSPALIATERSVTVGTVRMQIKTILAKAGVKRQVELAARLSQL
jgi:DNA-binding CsgD family transcriptional regulator